MDVKNDQFLMVLTNAKNSIDRINKANEEKEKVSGRIENIRKELNKIKAFLDKLDEVILEETNKLDSYKEEIDSIKFGFLRKDTDKIKNIIQVNLPNTVTYEEDESKIKLYRILQINENKNSKKNKENKKDYIGYIDIIEIEENKNRVNIKIEDKIMNIYTEEEFDVENPLRIYSIIVYLNMKLNYEKK